MLTVIIQEILVLPVLFRIPISSLGVLERKDLALLNCLEHVQLLSVNQLKSFLLQPVLRNK